MVVSLRVHEGDHRVGDGGNGEGEYPERHFDPALPGQVASPGLFGTYMPGCLVHPRILGPRTDSTAAVRHFAPATRTRTPRSGHFARTSTASRLTPGPPAAAHHNHPSPPHIRPPPPHPTK